MTRKDYVLLSNLLHKQWHRKGVRPLGKSLTNRGMYNSYRYGFQDAVNSIATVLREENDQFDFDRFKLAVYSDANIYTDY